MSNMEANTKEALRKWVCGAAPESFHPLDMERFYNVVYESIISDDYVSSEDLEKMINENLQWVEKKNIQNFAEEKTNIIHSIKAFLDYLKSEKGINVYNQF